MQGVALTDIPASRMYRQVVPDEASIDLPALLVTIEGESISVEPFDSEKDEVVYPVRLWACDRADVRGEPPGDKWTGWQDTIVDAFRGGRLLGVPQVYDVEVRPGLAVDERLPAYQWMQSLVAVRCKALKARAPVTA
jgi:hypothetical protein